MPIPLKNKKELDIMRKNGALLASVLRNLADKLAAGMSTAEIDSLAASLIAQAGAKPSFLGYNGFPGVVCVSINDEVVHGIPSKKRIINEGDLVSLDLGLHRGGFHVDSAITKIVRDGSQSNMINGQATKLIEVTRQSLMIGIEQAKVGNRVGVIGHAVQKYVESHGFGVVRELVGHGIGRRLHEEPHVPNYGREDSGSVLRAGMVLAIEPMITAGDYKVCLDDDDWTYRTADGSLSVHFEHTVAVTEKGPEVLTVV